MFERKSLQGLANHVCLPTRLGGMVIIPRIAIGHGPCVFGELSRVGRESKVHTRVILAEIKVWKWQETLDKWRVPKC